MNCIFRENSFIRDVWPGPKYPSESRCRSSNWRYFVKNAKFTENTRARVYFRRPEACNCAKKETMAQVFYLEFCETSKNTFKEHLRVTASHAVIK